MKLVQNGYKTNILIKRYNTFLKRLHGLMFVFTPIDYGILIEPCNSIHMFFMFQSIDVVMVNKDNIVVFLKKRVRPWSLILPKKHAFKTYELPLDTIDTLNISIGDILK